MSEIDPAMPLVDAEHPWLGLLSFTERTRKFFFGRDTEISEIIDRIQENTLTVLFGQSGLGKTSLLGAGVLPRLQEMGYAPVLIRLDHDPAAPSLLEQTRRALLGAMPGIAAPDDAAEITLWELLHRKPLLLPDDLPAPVILFDQFEEIFTLGDDDQAAAWIEQVSDLLQNRPPQSLEDRFEENRRLARDYDFLRSPVRFVFSLREDYLYHLERWKTRLPLLVQNRMSLQLLNGLRALDAVIGPASLRPTPLVSAEVAASIVRTVADVPHDTPLQQIRAVPPLLSLLCEQLNLARIAAGAETIDAEMVAKQSIDILQRFYDESFSTFPEDHRECIRQIVEDPPMVTEGGHRNTVVREDAEAVLRSKGVPNPERVFDALIHRRLLTAEEHGGLQRLEITHDVLVPLVVHSRKERRDRQIEREKIAAEELARVEAGKRARLRALLVGSLILLALSIIAGFYAFAQKALAERSADRADKASKVAIASEEKATIALSDAQRSERMAKDALARQKEEEEKQIALFRQASMSDQQAGVRGSDAGNSSEALAHFERALRYWPENTGVAQRGFSELLSGKNGAARHRFTSAFNSGVLRTIFNPDGTKTAAASASGEVRIIETKSGKVLWEHNLANYPRAIAFSPDGTKFATCGHDRKVKLFEADSGKLLTEFPFNNYVLTLDFSPDSKYLAAGSGDLSVRVFDLATSKVFWDRTAEQPILFTKYSPDGKQLLLGTLKGDIHMMDAVSGDRQWHFVFGGDVLGVAFHPDGSRVAVCSSDKTVRSFDAATGGNEWKYEFTDQCAQVAYSPDGNFLAAASDDATVLLVNLHTKAQWTYRCGNPIWGMDFSPDGNRILIASSDSTLRVMRTDRASVIWEEKFPHFVQCCAFSPDGDHIAAGSGDKTLRIFRDSGNGPVFTVNCENTISVATFHPDGKKISLVSDDFLVRTVDSKTGLEIWRDRIEGKVTKLAISGDGTRIYASAENKEICCYNAADGKLLWNRVFDSLIYSISASPKGHELAACLSDTKKVENLDADGKTLWSDEFTTGEALKLVVHSPAGDRIAAAGTIGMMAVYSPDGKRLWNKSLPSGAEITNLNFSPDGKTIGAGGKGNEFVLVKTEDGSEIWHKTLPGQANAGAFSPDGQWVAIAGSDNVVRVVRTSDGTDLWANSLPRSSNVLQFSPDSKTLLVASYDKSLRIFDASNGAELWSSWFGDSLFTASFSPDGSQVIGGGYDYNLRAFDLPPHPSGKEEADLLRSLFIVRGNTVFDTIGRLRSPSPEEIKPHLEALANLADKAHPSDFEKAILWENARNPDRTLSPASSVPKSRVAYDKFTESGTFRTAEAASRFAPWHPLSPAAGARFDASNNHSPAKITYLCKLTLQRLRDAKAKDGSLVAADFAKLCGTAAEWMKDLKQTPLALDTAMLGLEFDPANLACLRVIVALGSPEEMLTYGERAIVRPNATSFD